MFGAPEAPGGEVGYVGAFCDCKERGRSSGVSIWWEWRMRIIEERVLTFCTSSRSSHILNSLFDFRTKDSS